MSKISAGGKLVGTISLFTDSARSADRPSEGVEKFSGEANAAGRESSPMRPTVTNIRCNRSLQSSSKPHLDPHCRFCSIASGERFPLEKILSSGFRAASHHSVGIRRSGLLYRFGQHRSTLSNRSVGINTLGELGFLIELCPSEANVDGRLCSRGTAAGDPPNPCIGPGCI